MPDRPDPSPESGADSLNDLFRSLPDPKQPEKTASANEGPTPGSRRAARAAAAREAKDQAARVAQGLPPEPAPAAAEGGGSGATETTTPTTAKRVDTATQAAPVVVTAEPRATLDDLFAQEEETTKPAKPKRRAGCLIALIIVLVLVGGAVVGGVWVMNTYGDKINEVMGWGPPKDYEPGEATGEALVTISEGDSGADVSVALYRAGVTKTEDVFYDTLVDQGTSLTFFPGVYKFEQKMTAKAVIEAMQSGENKMENSALIREGLTVEATLQTIAESLAVPLDQLQAAAADPASFGVNAPSLEGWLFPALYEFAPESSAHDILAKLVERTRESLAAAGVPAGDEQRVLTIASIIEREARAQDDFYKVSRVIQNRLDQDMMLQMDSTAQYGYGELHKGSASTSEEAQHDDNPWNTYVVQGLPATPIANPGDLAIDAAMHPVAGPWLYFVTVNLDTGETVFTQTYEEHQAAIDKWRQWCTENPDSGC